MDEGRAAGGCVTALLSAAFPLAWLNPGLFVVSLLLCTRAVLVVL